MSIIILVKSAAKSALAALTGASVCTLFSQSIFSQPAIAQLDHAFQSQTALETHHQTTSSKVPGKAPGSIRSKARSIRFRLSAPPPDRGTPRAPHGTGSRGDCRQPAALPALSQLTGSQGLDLTISEYPQFWVYVPYAQAEVATAKFSLQNDDSEVYQQTVQLPSTPGILAISMPTTLPPLEMDESYRWYFELTCPQSDPTASPVPATVTGSVQRIAPSATLLNELAIAPSPLDTVAAYAENHIWYETLSQLAQLRLENPNDQSLIETWQALLSDPEVGLGDWADTPIVGEVMAADP